MLSLHALQEVGSEEFDNAGTVSPPCIVNYIIGLILMHLSVVERKVEVKENQRKRGEDGNRIREMLCGWL